MAEIDDEQTEALQEAIAEAIRVHVPGLAPHWVAVIAYQDTDDAERLTTQFILPFAPGQPEYITRGLFAVADQISTTD